MKKKIYIIGTAALMLVTTSCNDFLDQVPDDRTVINSKDAVKELLVSAYPNMNYLAFCEAMSDNAEDKGPTSYASDIQKNRNAYQWKEQTSNSQDSYTGFWSASYEAIAAANDALNSIEKLKNKSELKPYKGEALLSRAYNHFMLVNVFAENFNIQSKNSNLLGIPYVEEVERTVFVDYKRETLEKTYELIQRDLEAGINMINDNAYGATKAYHFNRNAANSFATRFYLYTADWNKVIEHADKVLIGDFKDRLRDWNGSYATMPYKNLKIAYTKSSEPANLLLAGTITTHGRYFATYTYGFGVEKEEYFSLASFVNNKRWAYKIYGNDVVYNIPKFEEYFKLNSINSTTGHPYIMTPLFVLEETLLNRAEAYAMLNNFDAALADINAFLSKRLKNYNADTDVATIENVKAYYTDFSPELTPFYALSDDQRAFVNCITDLRRREFLFEGLRWFDIKRFHIEVERTPFSSNEVIDVLTKDDLRRAVQIPQDARSYGVKPNPRN